MNEGAENRQAIRNIVFDMGGVLYRWEPDAVCRNYPAEDARLLMDAIYAHPDWRAFDHGDHDEDEMIERASARLPARLQGEAARLVRWYELTGPVEGMEDLAGELKEAGFALYLLSNTSTAFHRFRERVPALRFFSGEYISADHGLMKPDEAVFLSFLAEFGLRAKECLFIDDAEANVAGARSSGMRGIVFDGDAGHLRQRLREAGLPFGHHTAYGKESGIKHG